MTRRELETLIEGRKWTMLLKCLEVGEVTLTFPDIGSIKSFKAMAYDTNSDGMSQNVYSLSIDKSQREVKITTTRR